MQSVDQKRYGPERQAQDDDSQEILTTTRPPRSTHADRRSSPGATPDPTSPSIQHTPPPILHLHQLPHYIHGRSIYVRAPPVEKPRGRRSVSPFRALLAGRVASGVKGTLEVPSLTEFMDRPKAKEDDDAEKPLPPIPADRDDKHHDGHRKVESGDLNPAQPASSLDLGEFGVRKPPASTSSSATATEVDLFGSLVRSLDRQLLERRLDYKESSSTEIGGSETEGPAKETGITAPLNLKKRKRDVEDPASSTDPIEHVIAHDVDEVPRFPALTSSSTPDEGLERTESLEGIDHVHCRGYAERDGRRSGVILPGAFVWEDRAHQEAQANSEWRQVTAETSKEESMRKRRRLLDEVAFRKGRVVVVHDRDFQEDGRRESL